MVYLDHNATSCLRPQSRLAVEGALAVQGNPSSPHQWGRRARALVEEARKDIAEVTDAEPKNIVFTSGGTEANFLALWGAVLGAADAGAPIERLLVSAIEHESILTTARDIQERRPEIGLAAIPVSGDGVADIDALRVLLAGGTRALVAVMAANNETGVVQPIAEVQELVHAAGGVCVVDAVQACGKIAVDFAGADYLTVSAHKLGGPQGAGALVMRDGAPFVAVIRGGGQESNRRAGTENVAGIAGFGAAARLCGTDDIGRLAGLRDRFEAECVRRGSGTLAISRCRGSRRKRL